MTARAGHTTMTQTPPQRPKPRRVHAPAFNPYDHLMTIKSKQGDNEYLPTAWRLVWFHHNNKGKECSIITEETCHMPELEVETEAWQWNNETRKSEKIVRRGKGYAAFKATATDARGRVATGHSSCKASEFPAYYEKAETGAIGRALGALGYGTQFAPEFFEDPDDGSKLADSPLSLNS